VTLPGFDYDVPTPDWAKPSARSIQRAAAGSRGTIARWKALTR
jgi:hypothetical protein